MNQKSLNGVIFQGLLDESHIITALASVPVFPPVEIIYFILALYWVNSEKNVSLPLLRTS